MKRIFFLHNPKAAGSSLRALLASPFEHSEIAPTFLNSPYDERSPSVLEKDFKGYSFYGGHYGYKAYQTLANGHTLVTNFRNPVQRIESLYRYWKHNVDTSRLTPQEARPVELAQTLQFSDFIRHEDKGLRLYLENFHFRQLLNSGWESGGCTLWQRLVVKRRIAKMRWFFIQEMSDLSIRLLQQVMPVYRGKQLENVNVSGGNKAPLADADVDYIQRINEIDCEIYAMAVRLQAQRAAALHIT